MADVSSVFPAGYIVAKAQWFDLVQQGHRGYNLILDETTVSVNDMVRLKEIRVEGKPMKIFENKQGSGKAAIHLMNEQVHLAIEDVVADGSSIDVEYES